MSTTDYFAEATLTDERLPEPQDFGPRVTYLATIVGEAIKRPVSTRQSKQWEAQLWSREPW